MKNQEPTNKDILETINTFASDVQEKFSKIDGQFSKIDGQFSKVDDQFSQIKKDLASTELKMIDFMDDKFANLEGVVTVRQRKQDNKVNRILDALERFELLPKDEVEAIRSIQIFTHTQV